MTAVRFFQILCVASGMMTNLQHPYHKLVLERLTQSCRETESPRLLKMALWAVSKSVDVEAENTYFLRNNWFWQRKNKYFLKNHWFWKPKTNISLRIIGSGGLCALKAETFLWTYYEKTMRKLWTTDQHTLGMHFGRFPNPWLWKPKTNITLGIICFGSEKQIFA